MARDGVVFLAQPGVPLGWHVAFFGTYEPELREIFRAVLPSGGVALDVGANVGWHTLLMARLVGASGRVLAAEPNPSVRLKLAQNLNLNRLGHVDVIPFAMADSEGTVDFYGPDAEDASSGDGHVVAHTVDSQEKILRVETRCVDAIVPAAKLDRVDLIKIDVEGFEWPVLKGAKETIARFRPHVVFEYNAEYASRGGGTVPQLAEFFRKHGYRLFAIGRNWAAAVEPSNWPPCADIWAAPVG
ncbi:MAG: FkbM family methyltransferase [Candidatus Binatia bacterium]